MRLQTSALFVLFSFIAIVSYAQNDQSRPLNDKGNFSDSGVVIDGKTYHLINLMSPIEGTRRREAIPESVLVGLPVRVRGEVFMGNVDVYRCKIRFGHNGKKYNVTFEEISDKLVSGDQKLFTIE